MRLTFAMLFSVVGLTLFAQQHEIDLSRWTAGNEQSSEKVLVISAGDTLMVDDLKLSVSGLTFDLSVPDDEQPPMTLVATLTYDDNVKESFTYTLLPEDAKPNWNIEPNYANGRFLMAIDIAVTDGSGMAGITEVHYAAGGPVVDLTENQLPTPIELRGGKSMHGNVLVVPYPINVPPHLADCNARTVYFTASVVSADPKVMEQGSTLTVYATDYGQTFHDEFRFHVGAEPTEYSVTIDSARDVENLYFLIFQPAPRVPDIAIRQFRIEESDQEFID